MAYKTKIEALNQRKNYFETWQNKISFRLPGNKTGGMGKYGTPASKPWKMRKYPWKEREASKGFSESIVLKVD